MPLQSQNQRAPENAGTTAIDVANAYHDLMAGRND
jgi:hypothetical protein